MNKDNKKYIIVLLITTGIFIVVFGLVNFLNNQKIAHVEDLQQKITADLIAVETQFELLKTAPCDLLDDNVLSRELGDFGQKLDAAETNQGSNDSDVIQLKKYYSLLQVKDYLLMQELADKCDSEIDSILYFYRDNCPECTKQGYVLTELKKQYPELRIYSFDTDLDFSVIETFTSLYDFGEVYPTIIVGDDSYQGLQRVSEIEALFPKLVENKEQRKELDLVIEYILSELDIEKETLTITKVSDDTYTYSDEAGLSGEIIRNESNNLQFVAEE